MSNSKLRFGVVGMSEGDGHPYSFSSIINGYSRDGFAESDWQVILEYLEEKHPAEFGFPGVEVTHAWTQDYAETKQLCQAAKIPNPVDKLTNLREANLDGVIIARDDYRKHRELAEPFLEADLPVFVDKPLAMNQEDLSYFIPFIRDGTLMSCSGMRYARELDGPRSDIGKYGDLKVIRGTVLLDLPRYGIHVLEAILNVIDARPVAVTAVRADHASITIETDAGYPIQIDAIGEAPLTFDIDIYGSQHSSHHELRDNFQAFRRTLWHFIDGIRQNRNPIPPSETMDVIRTLIAGQKSVKESRRVTLAEFDD